MKTMLKRLAMFAVAAALAACASAPAEDVP